MLTLEKLKEMPPSVFAQGEIENKDLPTPMVSPKQYPNLRLRWVAKRGRIHDWTIYLYYAHESFERCLEVGDKTFSENNIKLLVPCNDEAFKMYRY